MSLETDGDVDVWEDRRCWTPRHRRGCCADGFDVFEVTALQPGASGCRASRRPTEWISGSALRAESVNGLVRDHRVQVLW
jgi:hypothetical protein